MIVETHATANHVAVAAAEWLGDRAQAAIAARGCFTLAVSGGRTPWAMLRAFVGLELPWDAVHLFQVDERLAPDGHVDRNWTYISDILKEAPATGGMRLHPMPAERAWMAVAEPAAANEPSPVDAADDYAAVLRAVAGAPPVLDVVHLGLGADGHTASLVPHDAALEERAHDVALTGVYQGRRRLTLTYPVVGRAREVLWVVTGDEKRAMVARLLARDRSIPAGRVENVAATLMLDRAAAS